MRFLFSLCLLVMAAAVSAESIIVGNASWAEINLHRQIVEFKREELDYFDAETVGAGLDLRFAVSDDWAIALEGTTQQQCEESLLVWCETDSDLSADGQSQNGWYKRQALGVTWNHVLWSRYAVELSYRRQREDSKLYDSFCYLWICSTADEHFRSRLRERSFTGHLPGVTARGQWGAFELALSVSRLIGEIDETQWRLENRFLLGHHFNLVLSYVLTEESDDLSFGVRYRW